jgi:hypothetical protein
MITKKSYENCLSVRQMFSKNLFLLFFFSIGAQQLNAQRAMYVSLLDPSGDLIVDNSSNVPIAQTQLLQYAKDNQITYLILYGLNDVLNTYELDAGLNNFINNATTNYCITKIGANIGCGGLIGFPSGTNSITNYNSTYLNRINTLVSEFEFWNPLIRDSDHCPSCSNTTDYPNVFYDYFIPLLDQMNSIKNTSGNYITSVDVYLDGHDAMPQNLTANPNQYPVEASQIFSNIEITNNTVYSLNETQWNINMVDNRADNIFITAYRRSRGSNIQLRPDYEAYINKSRELIKLFGNHNLGMSGNTNPSTIFKADTKIFPLFPGGKTSYTYNTTTSQYDFTIGYAGDYFSNDPLLMSNYNSINYNPNPTISSSFTPQEIEEMFFDDYQADLSYQIDPLTNDASDNILTRGSLAWYKYQFLAPSISLPLYTENNVLFSSNPTKICNQVTFDYSGPNEDGINYTWNFGDGTPVVTGTTSSTDQLSTSPSRIHVFPSSGTYTVTLYLTYPSGCSYSYSILYNLQVIGNVPNLSFTTSNTTGCSNEDGWVQVSNLNGNISSAIWTNSSGQVSATNASNSSTASNLPKMYTT